MTRSKEWQEIINKRTPRIEKMCGEIARLSEALDQALTLCRWCDGTGTVAIADVETGEQVGAQNCEKCWPIRINAGLEKPVYEPVPGKSEK